MTPSRTPGAPGTPALSTPSTGAAATASRLARVAAALWQQGGQLAAGVGARLGYLLVAAAVGYAVVDLQSDRLVLLYTQAVATWPGTLLTSVELQEPIRAGERLAVVYALAGVWPALCYHLWALGAGAVAAPTQTLWRRGLLGWAVSGPLHLYLATAVLWPWVARAVGLLALESLPGDLAGAGAIGGVRLANAVDLALLTLWTSMCARALPGALFWLGYAGGWTQSMVRTARWGGMLAALILVYGFLPTGLAHRVVAWTLLVAGLEVVWYRWSLAGPRQAYWMERLVGIPRAVWWPGASGGAPLSREEPRALAVAEKGRTHP